MGDKTDILWTATFHDDGSVTKGATWNPIRGLSEQGDVKGWTCARISPACDHCYAESFNKYRGNGKPYLAGQHATPMLVDDALTQPIRWTRGRFIFVCSMTDLAWDQHPDDWLDAIFATMATAEQHTFLVLTKRSERLADYLSDPATSERICKRSGWYPDKWVWPLPNVWIGATVENQTWAERRIPHLVRTPAAVRFLSCEPLLGPLDLSKWLDPLSHLGSFYRHQISEGMFNDEQVASLRRRPGFQWLIGGGESGGPPERALVEKVAGVWQPKREAETWARSLRDQCREARIAYFWKQWGGRTPKAGGRILDHREWNERPAGDRVRRTVGPAIVQHALAGVAR